MNVSRGIILLRYFEFDTSPLSTYRIVTPSNVNWLIESDMWINGYLLPMALVYLHFKNGV